MKITQKLINPNRYALKCPYIMKPKYITAHNTDNDASAKNEIAYMTGNDLSTSFHIAVDDVEAIQAIPFDRNAWHAGDGRNGTGNRNSIGVEICHSKSGGIKFIKAEKNAANVIAQLLVKYDLKISAVKRHMDWSGKNCPARTMRLGWSRFLKMVQSEVDKLKKTTTTPAKVVSTTKDMIKALQQALNSSYGENLATDGIRGSKTNAVLKKYTVRNYTSNAYVRWIQQRLRAKGYDITVDGKYGTGSAMTVKAFQKAKGLTVDGIVGYNTTCKLLQ